MCEIHIKIDNIVHEAYLRYMFQCPNGSINITCKVNIGKFIINRVKYSDFPVKKISDSLVLVLPKSNTRGEERNFLYFSAEEQKEINREIDIEMKREFREWIIIGREIGIQFKDIINAFIKKCELPEESDEMFKKFDYRRRMKIANSLYEFIQSLRFQ